MKKLKLIKTTTTTANGKYEYYHAGLYRNNKRILEKNLGRVTKAFNKKAALAKLWEYERTERPASPDKRLTVANAMFRFLDEMRKDVELGDLKKDTYLKYSTQFKPFYIYSHYFVDELTSGMIKTILINKKQNGIKNSTLDGYCSVMSKFLRFCKDNGYIKIMPDIPFSKAESNHYSDIHVLYPRQLMEILLVATKPMQLYLNLILSTGLRPSELNQLKVGAVNLFNKTVNIIDDKRTKRGGIVKIWGNSESWVTAIKNKNKSHYVTPFSQYRGQEQSEFKKLMRRSGQHLTATYMRHTFATYMLAMGHSRTYVSQILRNSETTVEKYYAGSIEPLLRYTPDELRLALGHDIEFKKINTETRGVG